MIEVQQEIMADSEEWFPKQSRDLLYHVLALNGEAGELANVMKKAERDDVQLSKAFLAELAMELADIYIYTLQCANIINIDIVAAYNEKRKLNVERFGS